MKKNFHIIVISFIISIVIWTSISLSGEYYLNVTMPLKLADFPEGFSIGSEAPDEVTVRVKGRGWNLLNLFLDDDIYLKASLRSDSGKINLNLLNSISENSWITAELHVLNIIPSILNVSVDKVIQKNVPVVPDLKLDFQIGYGIAAPILIDPDSVSLFGSYNLLKNVEKVKTEQKIFSQIDSDIETENQLIKIKGIRASASQVRISIDVQKIVDREFSEIVVDPIGVPLDRSVVFLPSTVNITLRGGIEIMGALNADSLTASVDYSDVLQDTLGSVAPKILLPQNVELIKIIPERIRYIIKKF